MCGALALSVPAGTIHILRPQAQAIREDRKIGGQAGRIGIGEKLLLQIQLLLLQPSIQPRFLQSHQMFYITLLLEILQRHHVHQFAEIDLILDTYLMKIAILQNKLKQFHFNNAVSRALYIDKLNDLKKPPTFFEENQRPVRGAVLSRPRPVWGAAPSSHAP